jgi:hypothetical protein
VSPSTRRTAADVIAFVSGLVILVIVISASDERARREVWRLLSADSGPSTLAGLSDRLGRIGFAAFSVVAQWSHLHPYLVAFAVVAGVVVLAVRRL